MSHHKEAFEINVPVRDARGQVVMEKHYNKETKREEWREKTVKKTFFGLGTWRCGRGCKRVGKSMRPAPGNAGSNVVNLEAVTVTRPIAVVTKVMRKEAARA